MNREESLPEIPEDNGPLLPDTYDAPDATVQRAHDSSVELSRQERLARSSRKTVHRAIGEVVVTRPDPLAWEEAQRLVKEQGWGYPVAQPDGSVVIAYNKPGHRTR